MSQEQANPDTVTGDPVQAELPSVSQSPAPEKATKRVGKKAQGGAEATPPANVPPESPEGPSTPEDAPSAYDAEAKIKELEAVIAGLKDSLDGTDAKVATHREAMKASVLDGLHVLPKYRDFAPDVDPFSEDGRKALETWAADNPELLNVRPSPVVDVDTDKLKGKMRSPHLVDFGTFSKSMKRG